MLIRNVITLIFACCFAVPVSAEPQLSVQLDRSVIYEGESFFYQLTVSDTSPIGGNVVLDTSTWTDFDVQPLGEHSIQRGGSSFTMIINGRTVSERTAASHQTQFRYLLTPRRTGSHAIPLPSVTVNGNVLLPQSFSVDEGERQMFADHSIAVRVLEPDDQDIVFLTIETNRNRLYPMQPLEVTLVVQIKGLPGRYANTDPLMHLREPPQLQIPWVAENPPQGFQPTQRLNNWLNSYQVRPPQRGFAINNFTSGGFGAFPGFGSTGFGFGFGGDMLQRNLLQFSGTPRQITRPDAWGNATTYREYRFTRTFIPQEFGNYSFGPVILRGVLPVADPDNPDGLAGQRIYAVARPVNVAVVDIPHENRPADYIGAFGTFRWDATLTPQQARVGDPMTLTLRLSGQGSMANVRPIDLSANPDVAANFRVHPPTDDFSGTFTYTIRPLNSGAIEFPPISVSVFDVNTERFVSLQSLPIPLEIADSEFVQSPTLFGNVPDGTMQLAEGGLFANRTTLSETLPPISFAQWAMTVSLLFAGYVMIATGVLLMRYQWVSPKNQRQRGALNRARLRLSAVSSALRRRDSVNLVDASSELQGAFFGYIADKTDGVEQGMTTSDVCRQLSENQVPEALVNAIRSALESLDAVKYGGMDIRSLDELTAIAGTLLQQLDRQK